MGIKVQNEEQFLGTVIEYALLNRWLVYHTRDSRRSQAGFPDLVLARDTTCVVAELKVGSNTTTPAQRRWLAAFAACGVAAYTWYPANWDEIESVLGAQS